MSFVIELRTLVNLLFYLDVLCVCSGVGIVGDVCSPVCSVCSCVSSMCSRVDCMSNRVSSICSRVGLCIAGWVVFTAE